MTALAHRDGVTVEPSLTDLIARVNREHALAMQAARGVLEHAIAAGEALLAIRPMVPEGWKEWIEDNCDVHWSTANDYMRVAHFKEHLLGLGASELTEAVTLLRGMKRTEHNAPGRTGMPDLAKEARQLVKQGVPQKEVCDRLGVSKSTVYKWANPDKQRKYTEKLAEEKRRLREQRERDQEVRLARAVRKKGGAIAELYALSERLQDTLADAHRECEDQEARRELALAGQHYRKMRDHVVRAVGVYA